MEQEEKYYLVNGVRLHVVEAGPPEGPVLVLLHGFPEFWYGWRRQVDYFATRGFRVVVPDQRGYNRSSKPSGVKAYALEHLTQDIAVLIRQVSDGPVYLAGHDWGGAVAWALGMHHPQLLARLIILNLPHPQVMLQNLRHSPRQLLRSWYVGFFQLPFLPEFLSQAFDFRVLTGSLTRTSRRGTFSPPDLARYKEAWRQPGALRSMLNWYRAFWHRSLDTRLPVHVPTLLLWGRKDAFLSEEMARPSLSFCTDGQLVLLDEATHWLHLEEPEKVNSLIYDFISRPRDEAAAP